MTIYSEETAPYRGFASIRLRSSDVKELSIYNILNRQKYSTGEASYFCSLNLLKNQVLQHRSIIKRLLVSGNTSFIGLLIRK